MRLFIAIEFDSLTKEYLLEQQKLVAEFSEKGNFTKINNFHITLVFLGDVNPNKVSILKDILDEASLIQKPFMLKFDNLGQFKRGNRKIIWIGTSKSDELNKLYKNLESNVTAKGFIKEKRDLVSHITLGREILLNISFEQLYNKINILPKELFVEKISLMESARIEGELKYIPIYCSNLFSASLNFSQIQNINC